VKTETKTNEATKRRWTLSRLDDQPNGEARWSIGRLGPQVYLTTDENTAALIILAVNAHDALVAACEAVVAEMDLCAARIGILATTATVLHPDYYAQCRAALDLARGEEQPT